MPPPPIHMFLGNTGCVLRPLFIKPQQSWSLDQHARSSIARSSLKPNSLKPRPVIRHLKSGLKDDISSITFLGYSHRSKSSIHSHSKWFKLCPEARRGPRKHQPEIPLVGTLLSCVCDGFRSLWTRPAIALIAFLLGFLTCLLFLSTVLNTEHLLDQRPF